MIAALQQAHHGGEDRAHARGGEERRFAAFERSEGRFNLLLPGIAVARVVLRRVNALRDRGESFRGFGFEAGRLPDRRGDRVGAVRAVSGRGLVVIPDVQ